MPAVPIPFMEIPTAIMALGMLGFELMQGVSILVNSKLNRAVDHVLVNENGLKIGVIQTKDGKLELLVDEDELREKEGMELKEFHEEVQKRYQYTQLIKRLQADGFSVVEETEEANETIRLVVRRWR